LVGQAADTSEVGNSVAVGRYHSNNLTIACRSSANVETVLSNALATLNLSGPPAVAIALPATAIEIISPIVAASRARDRI
jgi:hypothetical protein